MRFFTFVFVLALTAVTFAQEAAKEVTFKKWTPVVGAASATAGENSMSMEIMADMNGTLSPIQKQATNETSKGSLEILAVDGAKVTKVKVSRTKTKSAEGEAEEPISGKTFILELKEGKIVATDADQKPVSEELAKAAIEAFAPKGTLNPGDDDAVTKNLAGKTMKVGDKLNIPAKDLLNGGKDDPTLTGASLSLTLKELKDVGGVPCALFDIAGDLAMNPSPTMKMTIALKGACTIGVENGFTYAVEMAGPVKGGGDAGEGEQKMKITIDGTMAMKMTGTLTVPKK